MHCKKCNAIPRQNTPTLCQIIYDYKVLFQYFSECMMMSFRFYSWYLSGNQTPKQGWQCLLSLYNTMRLYLQNSRVLAFSLSLSPPNTYVPPRVSTHSLSYALFALSQVSGYVNRSSLLMNFVTLTKFDHSIDSLTTPKIRKHSCTHYPKAPVATLSYNDLIKKYSGYFLRSLNLTFTSLSQWVDRAWNFARMLCSVSSVSQCPGALNWVRTISLIL